MKPVPTLFDFQFTAPLDSFPLDIEYKGSQRVLGVFGVSGSGKTTLLECLAGLRKGNSGRIQISGETWLESEKGTRVQAKDREVGYVPQDHLLFPHLDVRGNLEVGRTRAVQKGLDFDAVFRNVIATLELETLLDRRVDQLSGGERQRVALGRALCSGPKLLLLDEPLSSLDASLRRKILPLLLRTREAFDLPMVVVSHNPIELQVLCDEVLFLERGKVVKVGSPNEFFASGSMFDVAKVQGFENVFSGTIVEKGDQVDRVCPTGDNPNLSIQIPATDLNLGERVVASIGSDNILIALEESRGLSARNCLPARIDRMEKTESRWLVHAALTDSPTRFVVEVTADAVEALSLPTVEQVFLLFKTSSVSPLSS